MPKNKKTIVFYCATAPSVIIYKIARILKANHYKTILLTMCEKDRLNHFFYNQAFNRIIYSNFQFSKLNFKSLFYYIKNSLYLIKFLFLMMFLKTDILIGVAGNNWQLKLVHKYFFRKYPFIYFPYDILSHFFKSKKSAISYGTPEFEVMAEKYCFDNCNGILTKGNESELDIIERRIHEKLDLKKPILYFLPYCSKEFVVPINKNKLSKIDKETHIVYVGSFPGDPNYIKTLLSIYKQLLDLKIHLHIYMFVDHIKKGEENEYTKNFFNSILKNKYFHLYKPLHPIKLIGEISKYDFGFWDSFYSKDYDKEDLENLSIILGSGNKFASYLEAGLPIIYDHKSLVLDKLMKKYETGIPFDKNDLKDLYKKINKSNYSKMEKNAVKAREELDIDKNFPRLEKFLKDVINYKLNNPQ